MLGLVVLSTDCGFIVAVLEPRHVRSKASKVKVRFMGWPPKLGFTCFGIGLDARVIYSFPR